MTYRSRFAVGAGALGLAILAACAPARTAYDPAPAPCVDSVYLELKAQPPDSLSTREWERLQSLDRGCAQASAQAQPQPRRAWWDDHHGGHWWGMGGVAMIVMMLVMML
jgi:hypothetical protein